MTTYQKLFDPHSIAVIGASNDALKPGGRVIKIIKENGYTGRLWAVNAKSGDILGLPTYPSIATLPETPDLAIVAIPAAFVLAAVQELAARKTGAAIILTAGFGEKDDAGKATEQKMALIGPNCSGFLTKTYKGKFAGLIPRLPGRAVDFISGSGATVDYVMERATRRGLSFGTVVNLGNSVQMGVEDVLELYDQNYGPDSARILMLYLESVRKPAKLLCHARSLVRKGCALIGIKSGTTEAGGRAAASHTGAMANSDTAVEALFEKAGIIRVQGRGALINLAAVLAAAKGRLKGKRVCIVTDAGGPGVMLSDELARQGLELPLLAEVTRLELARILPPESSLLNPIDALPSRTAEQFKAVIGILESHERERIDVIAVITGNSGLSDNAQIYKVISDAMQTGSIPVVPVLSSTDSCQDKIEDFISLGNVYFPDEVELGQALGKAASWMPPEDDPPIPEGYDRRAIKAAIADATGSLDPDKVQAILEAAGIPLPRQIHVFQQEALIPGCRQVGYPLAMKVIGPLHKTDVGGVRIGITDDTQALEAWQALIRVPEAQGVLIQPMIDGPEVILGASREGDFGHLVMFGLGGIFAEALKDAHFALAPLSRDESLRLIQGIQGQAIINGVRGQAGMNMEVLADLLQRLGRLVCDFPRIKEIDLNPIKGINTQLYAVDARIIVAD
jgi:acyl-CoA synthetase (NDP forming)